MNNINIVIRSIVLTAGILLIPLLGNRYIDGWNWAWTAFVFFGVVLFGIIFAYEIAGKYFKREVISGFVFGELIAYGVITALRHLNPNDDVAGVVIITFLVSGSFFAFVGYLIQNYFKRE